MATVHLGRLSGPVGFGRTVALKRLHPHYAQDPEFVAGFLDEARLASRVRHPNVVSVIDVIAENGELSLVMEYIDGEPLSRLLYAAHERCVRPPANVVCAIVCNMLHGLHAAHEAKTEDGEPLHIVHRDVSPHNVIVGKGGVAHVVDFGIAKAVGRLRTTTGIELKGKLAYMPPELLTGGRASPQVDIWAAAVVLWEALVGERLFRRDTEGEVVAAILAGAIAPPSKHVSGLPAALDAVVMRGLRGDPAQRFATAREMAAALESAVPIATASRVGAWVEEMASETLAARAKMVADIEKRGREPASSGSLGAVERRGSESETAVPVAASIGDLAAVTHVENSPVRHEELTSARPLTAVSDPRASARRARRAFILSPAIALVLLAITILGIRRFSPGRNGTARVDAPAQATPLPDPAPVATERGAQPGPNTAPPEAAAIVSSAPATSPPASNSSTPTTPSTPPRRRPLPPAAKRPPGAQPPLIFRDPG
jgi:serine/threonine-protein kinase